MDKATIERIIREQGCAPRFQRRARHSYRSQHREVIYVSVVSNGRARGIGTLDEIAQESEDDLRKRIGATLAQMTAQSRGGQ